MPPQPFHKPTPHRPAQPPPTAHPAPQHVPQTAPDPADTPHSFAGLSPFSHPQITPHTLAPSAHCPKPGQHPVHSPIIRACRHENPTHHQPRTHLASTIVATCTPSRTLPANLPSIADKLGTSMFENLSDKLQRSFYRTSAARAPSPTRTSPRPFARSALALLESDVNPSRRHRAHRAHPRPAPSAPR